MKIRKQLSYLDQQYLSMNAFNDYPLVSICIPSFNNEKYLGEALNSLFVQTYTNIEIIVVDDGSEDDTEVTANAVNDSRFKYYKQTNQGAAAARNRAFQLSSGKYIKFMDADDLLSPKAIEVQVLRIMGNDNCVASSKWGRFFDDDKNTFSLTTENVWKDLPGINWVVDSLIDHGSNMTQPGIFLIPRSLIEKVGLWDESLSLIDDFEFMTKIIVNCKYVLFSEDAVLMYRSGISNSLSRLNSKKHMESAFKALMSGVSEILKIQNNARSRLACANTLQLWAYGFYPHHLDIYNKTQARIDKLGGASINIKSGKSFIFLSKIFGWKNAVVLKIFLLKLFRKVDFNNFRFFK